MLSSWKKVIIAIIIIWATLKTFFSVLQTNSLKGNDRSTESNVPRSDLISKTYKWAMETKNERTSIETPFSHYKSRRSRAANSVDSGPIWPKFELVRDFMHFLVTYKYKKDRIKSNREKVETPCSPL